MYLTDDQIIARQVTYGCCSLNYLTEMIRAQRYGDLECAEKSRRMWLFMSWAKGVMVDTPVNDGEGCTTREFAGIVAAIADCYCNECDPPVQSCDVVPGAEVIAAVPTTDRATIQAGPPDEGDRYLIVSGSPDGAWTANTIQTWTSSAWVSSAVTANQIIGTEEVPTPEYWVTVTGASLPGLYFPPLDVIWNASTGLYSMISRYPLINTKYGRASRIIVLGNGGWTTIWSGNESELATAQFFNLFNLNPTFAAVVYTVGDCEWQSESTETPPYGECGTLAVSFTPTANCDDGTFGVVTNITGAVNFPIGGLNPIVNGTPGITVPASFGPTTVGGFDIDDEVVIRVINSFNNTCDIFSPSLRHPNFPLPDYTVTQAVDASFESSQVTGESYLIVSNTTGLTGGWAANVGKIFSNNAYITPTNLSFTFATDPGGPQGYWQMSAGTQIQVYPALVSEYNTGTGVYTTLPFTIAPHLTGTLIAVRYRCDDDAYTVVYEGLVEGLTEVDYTPACPAEDVSGQIIYYLDCPVEVDMVFEPFTPGDVLPPPPSGSLNFFVNDLALASDGSIYIGGAFSLWNSPVISMPRFSRLLPNTFPDTTFVTAAGTAANNQVTTVAVDASGNIVIAGWFTQYNGVASSFISRVLSTGARDASMNVGTGFTGNYLLSLAIMGDGTIICGGQFSNYNGTGVGNIIALNPNGTINTSWAFGTGFNTYSQHIARCANGDIMVVGLFSTYNGTPTPRTYFRALRIQPDGTINSGFNPGTGFNQTVYETIEMPDGKFLFVGNFTTFNGQAARYVAMVNADGTLNTAFTSNTNAITDIGTVRSVVLDPVTGKIYLAGWDGINAPLPQNKVIRLNSDGTRDNTFTIGAGTPGRISSMAIDQDDQILVVGGSFTTFNGQPRANIVRLHI